LAIYFLRFGPTGIVSEFIFWINQHAIVEKGIFIFGIMLIALTTYSQITFREGYLITKDNERLNCLIKDVGWKNNPTKFNYKLSETGTVETASIDKVSAFGIGNGRKFVSRVVKIDRSSKNLKKISNQFEPEFQEEELFLKVLVEGKSNLYQYVDDDVIRYFYTVDDSAIEQLVYKVYQSADHRVKTNEIFKNQLLEDLKCEDLTISKITNLKYREGDLKDFFLAYSECYNFSVKFVDQIEKSRSWFIGIRPILSLSSLNALNRDIPSVRNVDFGSKIDFGLGIEIEYILPFNHNKWSLLIEPTYRNFRGEETYDADSVDGDVLTANVTYYTIEFAYGLRYYSFLNDNSKIFINILSAPDFSPVANIKYDRLDGSLFDEIDLFFTNGFGFGLGYKQGDRFNLELRYYLDKQVPIGSFLNSNYKTMSLIFGYYIL